MKKRFLLLIFVFLLLAGCKPNDIDVSPVPDHDAGTAVEEQAGFSAYSGPILTLTLAESNDALTAERTLAMDISGKTKDDSGVPLVTISDKYTLTNTGDSDAAVTLMYPLSIDFHNNFGCYDPHVSIDGQISEAQYIFGDRLTGWTEDGLNPEHMHLPEQYEELLFDGTYFAKTLAELPDFGETVTVFTFTNCVAPSTLNAPKLGVSYDLKGVETPVLTYGFNGFEGDYYGKCTRDFSVKHGDLHMVIFYGDVPEDYEITFGDGGDDVPSDGFDFDFQITEMTVDQLLQTITADYVNGHMSKYSEISWLSEDALYHTMAMMYDDCFENGIPNVLRYEMFYSLDEVLSDVCGMERLVYLTFEVIIPTGESIEAIFNYDKAMSYNYYDTGDTDINGIDLFRTLGSNLEFTSQQAVLTGDEPESTTFEFDENHTADIIYEYYDLIIRK